MTDWHQMDREEFIRRVNRRHAAGRLPPLDARDLPELERSGAIGSEPAERDVGSTAVREFLRRKLQRIDLLRVETVCTSCGGGFIPASDVELYLYCDLAAPPPQGYCPGCLTGILRELESRQSAENMRCCG